MLFVLLLLPLVPFLAADRPQPPARALVSPAAALGQGDPRPPQPARPARGRLRAVVEEREGDTSGGRFAAASEPTARPGGPRRSYPPRAGSSSEPLFRTFCVFLC